MLTGTALSMFRLVAVSLLAASPARACCPNNCMERGKCNGGVHGSECKCACIEGWTGPDCSQRTCPLGPAWFSVAAENDVAHVPMECSNMGRCERSLGICLCQVGFTGKACERLACPNLCQGKGKCLSMRQRAATKDPGLGTVHRYDEHWDADRLYGCQCDGNNVGVECLFKKCPTGDDFLTTGQVNEQQSIVCRYAEGHFTLTWKGRPSARILATDSLAAFTAKLNAIPGLREVAVTFAAGQEAICNATGAALATLEFRQDFGPLRMLAAHTDGLTGTTASTFAIFEVVKGTKEDADCSNHGVCDSVTGLCTCAIGFDVTSDGYGGPGTTTANRGDCGYALSPVTFCPGEVPCSGHGACSGAPTYSCACVRGWMGGDCSLRACNFGTAWVDDPIADNVAHQAAECSNMGSCDRTKGECQCVLGFEGGACERLSCPGSPPCTGHGQCLSLQLAAGHNSVNGEALARTYGAAPNDAARWDYESVYGCVCDEGFTGYDCSRLECPRGDDPLTRGGSPEVQVVHCTATTGSFTLRFRDAETAPILFTATEAELKAALESLPTIGAVSVVYSVKEALPSNATVEEVEVADRVCTALGTNRAKIMFLTEFGDLPDLTSPTRRFIANMAFELDGRGFSVRGTKENDVCSNRGLCDYALGECACFTGFGNSDGFGNEGQRGDCGHLVAREDPKKFV
eukprot:g7666.t1